MKPEATKGSKVMLEAAMRSARRRSRPRALTPRHDDNCFVSNKQRAIGRHCVTPRSLVASKAHPELERVGQVGHVFSPDL